MIGPWSAVLKVEHLDSWKLRTKIPVAPPERTLNTYKIIVHISDFWMVVKLVFLAVKNMNYGTFNYLLRPVVKEYVSDASNWLKRTRLGCWKLNYIHFWKKIFFIWKNKYKRIEISQIQHHNLASHKMVFNLLACLNCLGLLPPL